MKGAGRLFIGILIFSSCTLFDELLEPGDVMVQLLDDAVPGVSITTPANGYISLTPEITVSGTANITAPLKVVRVQVQLNNGVWSDASGIASWSKGLTLIEGSNLIYARAIADNGETNTGAPWVLYASKYGWTHRIGGSSDDYGKSITVDAAGNVYITGSFSSTVDFAADWGQSDSKSTTGFTDIFITKINADGSYGWTHRIGDTGFDSGNSMTVDSDGNVYVTGYFDGTVDFENDWGGSDSKASISRDIFITKINADGMYGWTKKIGGTGSDQGNSVAVDTAGNVYLTGSFNSKLKFGLDWGQTNYTTNMGGMDIFITKISNNGDYCWTHRIGGGGNDYGYGIVVDLNGNVFVSGTFQTNNINFGADFSTNDIRNYTGKGFNDVFVTKISSDGDYGWTRIMGGVDDDTLYSIAVDANGDVYVTGYFMNQVVFDSDFGTSFVSKSAFMHDVFVMKILSDGSYGWAKKFGGFNYDEGKSITVSQSGDVYFTGSFFGTVNFADEYMQAGYKVSAGSSDIFITKLNADGTYGWTKRIGGLVDDIGYGVAVDVTGAVYLTGVFMGTNDFAADFSGSDVKTNQSGTTSDIFITKIVGW